jgi:lysophospholipase L1-like esterase
VLVSVPLPSSVEHNLATAPATPPATSTPARLVSRAWWLRDVRQRLVSCADANERVHVVDAYVGMGTRGREYFADDDVEDDVDERLLSDGLHPNALGYSRWLESSGGIAELLREPRQ